MQLGDINLKDVRKLKNIKYNGEIVFHRHLKTRNVCTTCSPNPLLLNKNKKNGDI